MFKLCRKDYLACRWLWLLALLIFGLYAATPMGWFSLAYMLMGAALVVGCLLIMAVIEDKNKTETLYGSLPLKRSTIVAGKYLLAGLLTIAGGIVIFGGIFLIARIVKAPNLRMDPRLMFSFDGAVGYGLVVIGIIALYLPFYLGFGLARGSFWFSAAVMALSLALFGAERFLARTLLSQAAILRMSAQEDIGGAFIRLIGSLRESVGGPVFVLLVALAAAIPAGLSLAISIRLYQRREF